MRTRFPRLYVVGGLALSACAADVAQAPDESEESPEPELAKAEQELFYDSARIWDKKTLSVCFMEEAGTAEAAWIRDVVERTWSQAADITFTGWDLCAAHMKLRNFTFYYDADIRIRVGGREWPRSTVGTQAIFGDDGIATSDDQRGPSMWLNFFRSATPVDIDDADKDHDDATGADFAGCYSDEDTTGATGTRWSSGRRACIEVIAAHEFGHALGIAHEQNRPDSTLCSGNDGWGDTTIGSYDPVSIMNYCTPLFNNDAYLSAYDIAGIQTLYDRAGDDYLWWMFGDTKNFAGGTEHALFFRNELQGISGSYPRSFTGDFNGDGREDIFWYAPGAGVDRLWYGAAGQTFTQNNDMGVEGDYIPVVGRFNGDWIDDIYWYAPGSGRDYIWFGRSNNTFNTAVRARAFNASGDFVPLAGDFNGDGRGDIFWYQAGSGADYLWWGEAGDGVFTEIEDEVSGTYLPKVGDFDGDRRDDILWYGPAQRDTVWYGNADRSFKSTATLVQVGRSYHPFVGDFDGNGADDVFWYRTERTDDSVWLGQVGSRTPIEFLSDIRGDYLPLVGDFDANGKDDIFLYGQ